MLKKFSLGIVIFEFLFIVLLCISEGIGYIPFTHVNFSLDQWDFMLCIGVCAFILITFSRFLIEDDE